MGTSGSLQYSYLDRYHRNMENARRRAPSIIALQYPYQIDTTATCTVWHGKANGHTVTVSPIGSIPLQLTFEENGKPYTLQYPYRIDTIAASEHSLDVCSAQCYSILYGSIPLQHRNGTQVLNMYPGLQYPLLDRYHCNTALRCSGYSTLQTVTVSSSGPIPLQRVRCLCGLKEVVSYSIL